VTGVDKRRLSDISTATNENGTFVDTDGIDHQRGLGDHVATRAADVGSSQWANSTTATAGAQNDLTLPIASHNSVDRALLEQESLTTIDYLPMFPRTPQIGDSGQFTLDGTLMLP
jgi:hypothetical protein